MKTNNALQKMIEKQVFNIYDYAVATNNDEYSKFFKGRKKLLDLSGYNKDICALVFNTMVYLIEVLDNKPASFSASLLAMNKYLSLMPKGSKKNIDSFVIELNKDIEYFYTKSNENRKIRNHLYTYYDIKQANGDFIKRMIWNLYEIGFSEDRINNATLRKCIDFRVIKNNTNIFLLKKYIYYLIFDTNVSITTITGAFGKIKNCLNTINKPYTDWTKDDAVTCFDILSLSQNKKSIGSSYMNLNQFTRFLIEEEYLIDSPIKTLYELNRNMRYEYKQTSPDDYAVAQIFSKLNTFDPEAVIWFLLIKCTGKRGGDISQTSRNCLEKKENDEGKYIYKVRTHSSKMKKESINIIPENLYNLINNWLKSHPSDSKYLFPSHRGKGKCIQRQTMVNTLKKDIDNAGIKNADGTPYIFQPHTFRHLMAVKMRENDIPLQFIQEQLHHDSPEMTLAYMEYTDKQMLKDANNFYDKNGDLAPIDIEMELTDEEKYVEYLNKYINARTLVNGICSKSSKLGPCSHGNACLDCQNFRTNSSYLPALKNQLAKAKVFLNKAKENGWLPQIKTNEQDIKKLENLINKIEYTPDTTGTEEKPIVSTNARA